MHKQPEPSKKPDKEPVTALLYKPDIILMALYFACSAAIKIANAPTPDALYGSPEITPQANALLAKNRAQSLDGQGQVFYNPTKDTGTIYTQKPDYMMGGGTRLYIAYPTGGRYQIDFQNKTLCTFTPPNANEPKCTDFANATKDVAYDKGLALILKKRADIKPAP